MSKNSLFLVLLVCLLTIAAASPVFIEDYKFCKDGFYGNDVDCYECARKLKNLVAYGKCCAGEEAYVKFCNVFLE